MYQLPVSLVRPAPPRVRWNTIPLTPKVLPAARKRLSRLLAIHPSHEMERPGLPKLRGYVRMLSQDSHCRIYAKEPDPTFIHM